MIVVSNSTPLISLAKIGRFDLMDQLRTQGIRIGKRVYEQVLSMAQERDKLETHS